MSKAVPRVFLDTEIFVRGNFDYKSARFDSLRALAAAGTVKLVVTDLTVREVEANIRNAVKSAAVAGKPNPVLKNSVSPEVQAMFKKLDVVTIQDELISQLKEYLGGSKVEIVKVAPSVLPRVLDSYFDRRAPFGPGKNKAEFPDALVLETLRDWCDENDCDLAVVSPDDGVKAACGDEERFHQFENLADYLDSLLTSDEALSSFVRQMIGKSHAVVLEMAKKAFPQYGAVLVNQDGEVDEIELDDVTFSDDPDDLEIISLDPGNAVVELAVSTNFSAHISYNKQGTGTWDSEDKILMFQDEVEDTVHQEFETTLVVEVTFKDLDPKSFEVQRVWFEGEDTIDVYADEDW